MSLAAHGTPTTTDGVNTGAGGALVRSGPHAGDQDPVASVLFDTEPHITSELSDISQKVDNITAIRRKYMSLALQDDGQNPKDSLDWPIYPPPPEPAWVARGRNHGQSSIPQSLAGSAVLQPDILSHITAEATVLSAMAKASAKKRKPGHDIGEDFDLEDLLPLPTASQMTFTLDGSGVYQVFEDLDAEQSGQCFIQVPTIKDFYMDLEEILNVSSDGPGKSFAFRRLQYLEAKFNLYILINEYQETADSKKVPHRDFYNVRKVDTHVHHSACMNQKHLLRFIKSKMKKCPDEIVLFRDGKHLTLAEVFKSINLTAYDLSIDTLDMHVGRGLRRSFMLGAVLRRAVRRLILTRSIASTNSTSSIIPLANHDSEQSF